jgi:tetratricopeptide (TPR) repeat protein
VNDVWRFLVYDIGGKMVPNMDLLVSTAVFRMQKRLQNRIGVRAKDLRSRRNCPTATIALAVLVISLSLSCTWSASQNLDSISQSSAKQDSDKFQAFLNGADEEIIEGDFENARKTLQEAVSIAEKRKWVNESAAAKVHIAETYLAEKKYELEESILQDAANTCESNIKCDPEQLTVIFEHMSTLNIYFIKDIRKQRQLVEAALKSPIYAANGTARERTCHFIAETRSAGYLMEANMWWSEFSCE